MFAGRYQNPFPREAESSDRNTGPCILAAVMRENVLYRAAHTGRSSPRTWLLFYSSMRFIFE